MRKICTICKKEFIIEKGNKKYCSQECKKKAYKNYKFYSEEATKKYREKVKEELSLDDTEFNAEFRERTANNKGMTVQEYNRYLERERARKLGITVEELRHAIYMAKKNCWYLHEELGMTYDEYKAKLSRKNN